MIIYLAGPDVFHKDAVRLGEAKKDLCKQYGFKAIFPLDDITSDIWEDSLFNQGYRIRQACIESMNKSDIILANMTPFRGAGMDGGTAFEMGYMEALGKPVYAYSNDPRFYVEKIEIDEIKEGIPYDTDEFLIEDFQAIDNCMMTHTVFKYMKSIPVTNNIDYWDFSSFERALNIIKEAK